LFETLTPDALSLRGEQARHNEPEEHLDEVSYFVKKQISGDQNGIDLGLSYKDGSLLNRLTVDGDKTGYVLSLEGDLDIADDRFGLETIGEKISLAFCKSLRKRIGPARTVVARHILEHVNKPRKVLEGIRAMLSEDGFLIVEVPECTSQLGLLDHTLFWEEHILYFTKRTLGHMLSVSGFDVVKTFERDYGHECVIAVVARMSEENYRPDNTVEPLSEGEEFYIEDCFLRERFDERKEKVTAIIEQFRNSGGNIVLYGAGHLGALFVNMLGVSSMIDYAIDDDEKKCGGHIAGTNIRIWTPDRLPDGQVACALLSVRSSLEDRLIQRLRHERGETIGTIASIFPGSRYAIDNVVRDNG